MSLPLEVELVTLEPAAAPKNSSPVDWVWAKPSGPQEPLSHSLPETFEVLIFACAPALTWMPFWAIAGVAPAPITVVVAMLAVEPLAAIVMPFFW